MAPMLCPLLVGRGDEVSGLTAALDAAADGHGGVVFVTGDEGVGKSRLTEAVRDQAAARQFTVLTGRATQSTVPVAYRPVSEALISAARSGVVPEMPRISNYRAALGSLVPEWNQPSDARAHVSPVVVGEAVLRLLTDPGGNGGGLLVLEDLHWADPETLDIVEYLADNAAAASILCVVTLRDDIPSACLDLLRRVSARRAATTVHVARLSPAAVRQMAAACLEVAELPVSVSGLLPDCDGLPLAVEEILAAAASSGELVKDDAGWHLRGDGTVVIPDSIAASVQSRLASLGPAIADVIVSAAVLGRQFDWALLCSAAGVGEAETLVALQSARGVQLIEPSPANAGAGLFRFRHSLTRDVILAGLMPAERSSRARSTAEAIERANPGLPGSWCEQVAELYSLAGQPLPAVRLLVTSARRALLKGAVSSALAALDHAGKLLAEAMPDDPVLGIEVDEVMLEAFAQAGDAQHLAPLAENLITRLQAAGADPRREVLVRLAAASTRPEDAPITAASHLAAAAAIADRIQDRELAARIDVVAARNWLTIGELATAEQLAGRGLATAEAAGLTGWAAEVALEALETIGRRERARDLNAARRAFERSGQIADSQELGIWRIRARHELSTIDMLQDGSARRLREVRQLADDAGATCVGTAIGLQLTSLSSLGGELGRAKDMALKCQRTAAQIKAPRIQAMAICLEASIAAIRVDQQQAELAAQRAEAVVPGDPEILLTTWGYARVLASLFGDDLPRALAEDAAATSYADEALAPARPGRQFYSALQSPLFAPHRALALHAFLTVVADGDSGTALERARSAGADTSWNAGWLAYAEAVQAGRDGDTSRAAALARTGRMRFEPFAPWWNHLARRLIAPVAMRDGWGDPASWLREAAVAFESTAHTQLASACRAILRAAGERVPRSGRGTATVPARMCSLGVTSREMDVFLLVARGHSDCEIASKLFIAPKTVQTHVASLVAKIGAAGRRELVTLAAHFDSGALAGENVRPG
jgi:DNA-binding CsgD family transcriptional regulator